MSEKTGNEHQSTSTTEWMNMMTEFWSPIMNSWTTGMQAPQSAEKPQNGDGEPLEGFVRMWQSLIQAAGEPADMVYLHETAQVVPDLLMGFAQTCMRGFTRFQKQVNQWMDKKEGAFSLENAESMKKAFLEGWTESYEKEFRQFFKMPQIGLARVYQERMLQAADKHNLFQVAFSKFLHQLYVPMEEAFDQLKQQMAEHAKTDQVEADPKTYYNLWVKILEGSYMKLFKQPDFSKILGQTLVALNEYSLAKQAVVNDMLKQNAIPTHEDLDELYKEIHQLKKRLRILEKQ